MPHSMGGSSHSGGSFSGSSSSHGSSSSSSSRPSRSTHYSSHYNHRYVYYSNRRPHYIYTEDVYDASASKVGRLISLIGTLIFLIPFYAVGLYFLAQMLLPPRPVKPATDNKIYIEDNLGVIKDREPLYAAMTQFRDSTGVTPMVLTVTNSEWKTHYDGIEAYAYDMYLSRFKDEKHCLIIYSNEVLSDGWDDWVTVGMMGNDTSSLIDESNESRIMRDIDVGIRQYDVGQGMTYAFEEASEYLLEYKIEWPAVGFLALWFSVVILITFSVIHGFIKDSKMSKSMANAQEIPMPKSKEDERSLEVKCAYCDGIYIPDNTFTCPHCGAASAYYTNR